MAARQRGVAAQRISTVGREPAQLPVGLAGRVAARRRRSRRTCSPRDRLQHLVGQPLVERHHRRLVAGEGPVGEGVDVPVGQLGHSGIAPLRFRRPRRSGVAGLVDMAFGIEVDQHLARREIRAASSRLDLVRSRRAPRRRVIAGSIRRGTGRNRGAPLVRVRRSCSPAQLGMARGDARRSAGASPRAIPVHQVVDRLARRAPGAPAAARAAMPRPNSGSAPLKPRYWSSTSAAITARLSSRSDW